MSLPFHPLVRRWFDERFEAPTEAQEAGWPAIAEGRHTLIAAPTGSGKTLAAFMTCIDRLVRAGLDGGLPERTEVVYVSPLKALSNDIRRNLDGAAVRDYGASRGRGRGDAPGGDPRRGAHRRHACQRAAGDGEAPAAHTDHDTRVSLHPAHVEERARRT